MQRKKNAKCPEWRTRVNENTIKFPSTLTIYLIVLPINQLVTSNQGTRRVIWVIIRSWFTKRCSFQTDWRIMFCYILLSYVQFGVVLFVIPRNIFRRSRKHSFFAKKVKNKKLLSKKIFFLSFWIKKKINRC